MRDKSENGNKNMDMEKKSCSKNSREVTAPHYFLNKTKRYELNKFLREFTFLMLAPVIQSMKI